jgi:F-type H+-transporting ATPase subunit b
MDLNLTLLGQMITFAILVGFTMKFVWPPIIKAMAERQQKIADGLAAAERGVHELELAHHKAADRLRDAKIQAAEIIDKANKRAGQIIEEAKQQARTEGKHLLVIAQSEIAQEMQHAKQILREQLAGAVIAGVEKVLERTIDASANNEIFEKLADEI